MIRNNTKAQRSEWLCCDGCKCSNARGSITTYAAEQKIDGQVSGRRGSYTIPQVMYLLSLCANETGTKTLKRGLH